MSNSWPVGVPETLWNYGRLQIQDIPQIPMMGVDFSREFVVAFVAGVLFLAYVAWDRFEGRPSGDQDFRYRVMKELEVGDLGGRAALRQAYLIYLTTLLGLYVAMTFFGKLILQTVNALNVVGIEVDASALQFDSPSWPLMLAFGFAGLAPLIPQLKAAETWLFRRAYRAVGIPVRIHETTRNLVDLLDAASARAPSVELASGGAVPETPDLSGELTGKLNIIRNRIAGSWVEEGLAARPAKLESGLALLAQLELLVGWARGGRGAWPGSDVSDQVRDVERKVAGDADDLLDGLYKRLLEGPPRDADADTRRKQYLADTLKKARELRDELAAILGVYVERDPTFVGRSAEKELRELAEGADQREPIRDPGLRELLQKTDPPNLAGTGPELGVLICIAFAVPVYAMLAWQELHPLLSQQAMPSSLQAVSATAGLEGLRLLSIFWFPLLTAFAIRQYYYDEGTWIARATDNGSSYAEQRLTVVALSAVVSIVCLSGVAALWAFFIAKDVSSFQSNFVGSGKFLLFYGSMAVVSIPLVWFTLIAADARAHGKSAAFYGVTSAVLVTALQGAHLAFWYGRMACTEYAVFLTDLFTGGCFRFYGGLDYFVMPILAYLAAAVFGNPRPASHLLGRWRLARLQRGQAAAVLAMALVSVCFAATGSVAQETPSKPIVTIGFRADAEPFSYKVNGDGGERVGDQPLYRGYLADLCYWIFDGGDYSVLEREVTAGDRFEQLGERQIDVLCDPVTMRFSDEERVASGTYSPIVFATGISYLKRFSGGERIPVYIGYVRNSTAAKILEQVCLVDLFRAVAADQRAELATMCQTATAARRIAEDERAWAAAKEAAGDETSAAEKRAEDEKSGPRWEQLDAAAAKWSGASVSIGDCQREGRCERNLVLQWLRHDCKTLKHPDPGRAVYRFCPMETHTDLIEWFCTPRTGQRGMPTLVYLGDQEIILGKLQTWNERHTRKCTVDNENGGENLTYEPYALMVAKPSFDDTPREMQRRQEIAELVQRRIYEFFSFGAFAKAKFDTYFLGPRKDRTMSTALAYLFLLNAVEEERRFTYPMEEAAAAD